VRRLQIATSLHVLAEHGRTPGVLIEQAADLIKQLAAATTRTRDDERLIADLEKRTGVPIIELAALTKGWMPRG
jgi:hypothetical protein